MDIGGRVNSFTPISGQPITLVDPSDYYSRHRGYGPGEPIIELSSDMDHRLDIYFNLPVEKKIAMARAAELLGTAQDIWLTSRSVSLAAAVFAVETLIHVEDPAPKRCKDCNTLLSIDHCDTCGAPLYGLMRRFRDFVNQYAESDDSFVKQLYEVRSTIAHTGCLLRKDEFDSGFNVGGRDDESELESSVTSLVRSILLGWLSDQ